LDDDKLPVLKNTYSKNTRPNNSKSVAIGSREKTKKKNQEVVKEENKDKVTIKEDETVVEEIKEKELEFEKSIEEPDELVHDQMID
jgi:hypothetical protein